MDLFGYWAPTEVTDTQEEYRAVRETAGLMDFTMLRKIDFDGDFARDRAPSDGPASTDSSAAPAGDAEPTEATKPSTESDSKAQSQH